jgi:hypothetical protein
MAPGKLNRIQHTLALKPIQDRHLCEVGTLRHVIQIWRFPPKASQEDGNHTTRSIRVHFLRQEHSEATFSRDLDLQSLQENSSRWCMDSLVSVTRNCLTHAALEGITQRLIYVASSTPAAAATRSTIRRLREIAEV